jgi:hypothetical protein
VGERAWSSYQKGSDLNVGAEFKAQLHDFIVLVTWDLVDKVSHNAFDLAEVSCHP